jgi:alkaline phosphatase D
MPRFALLAARPVRALHLAGVASLALLASCASVPATDSDATPVAASAAPTTVTPAPANAIEALRPYYLRAGLSLPVAPPMRSLPAADAVIDLIAIGSCRNEEAPAPIVDVMASRNPDLALLIGDNVYGDMTLGNVELPELQKAFADLALQPDMKALAAAVPILAAWDDHDFGLNDAGGDFAAKEFAERLHETFWGAGVGDAASRPGTYFAKTFGPQGKRVQIIMLDTRFFRTRLTDTDQRNAAGKERYIPSQDPNQSMLGDAQWDWLSAELKKPADVRLLVSSIQVLADTHGWEAWRTMPKEQSRLYQAIDASGANGVVLVSGDRHLSALYRDEKAAAYPLYELTASSLNMSFREENDEMGTTQLGAAYSKVNFGEVAIDWDAGALSLRILGLDGSVVREQSVNIADLRRKPLKAVTNDIVSDFRDSGPKRP